MKLFRFTDPSDSRFARAGRRGRWSEGEGLCGVCGASQETRRQPLVIEWEPGSDLVGDFVWPGLDDDVALTRAAFEVLAAKFSGFEAGPVEMIEPSRSPRRSGSSSGYSPTVRLPYEGPELVELWVTARARFEPAKSHARRISHCETCGAEAFEVDGVERVDVSWDSDERVLRRTRVPALAGRGLHIDRGQLNGASVFRVLEFPAWLFCTEAVRDAVCTAALSNVAFLEMGSVSSGRA